LACAIQSGNIDVFFLLLSLTSKISVSVFYSLHNVVATSLEKGILTTGIEKTNQKFQIVHQTKGEKKEKYIKKFV
jgi:hypothetical protein